MPFPSLASLALQTQPRQQTPVSLRALELLGTPLAETPATRTRTGDFDKLMQQAANLLAHGGSGQDAAIAVYFQALDATTNYTQAMTLASTVPNRWATRDVTFAALGNCITHASNREQALAVAELAWNKGHAFDRWGAGALDKALLYSTTPAQAAEVARLSQQHNYLERYRGIEKRAAAKAGA
jgi:hypothetical protein